jgi:hypothetical protein
VARLSASDHGEGAAVNAGAWLRAHAGSWRAGGGGSDGSGSLFGLAGHGDGGDETRATGPGLRGGRAGGQQRCSRNRNRGLEARGARVALGSGIAAAGEEGAVVVLRCVASG